MICQITQPTNHHTHTHIHTLTHTHTHTHTHIYIYIQVALIVRCDLILSLHPPLSSIIFGCFRGIIFSSNSKAFVSELLYVARSSGQLPNPIWSEAIHNVSAYRLASYYQPQLLPVVQWLLSLEMDTATRVQILDETDCISQSTDTLGKSMNPLILPLALDKW